MNDKRFGYKLKKVNSQTLTQCQDLCNKDDKCIHADWFEPNGNCYLRKMRDTDKWQTFEKNGNVIDGKRYGYKHKKIPKQTLVECQNACKNDGRCIHGDWYEKSGNCYLRKKKESDIWKTFVKGEGPNIYPPPEDKSDVKPPPQELVISNQVNCSGIKYGLDKRGNV